MSSLLSVLLVTEVVGTSITSVSPVEEGAPSKESESFICHSH